MPARALLSTIIAVGVLVACSGREDQTAIARARLSAGCAINSDCVDGLVCAYGRCHVACVTSRDCPGGRCVAGPASSRAAGICQLDGERACARNSDCPGTQLCGPDDACRDACAADRDCRDGEVCAAGTCAAPAEAASSAFAPRPDAVCRYASDCPGDLVCLRGRCDLECIGDKDCRVSWSCRDTRCRPPGYVGPTFTACARVDGDPVSNGNASVLVAASGGNPTEALGNTMVPRATYACVVRSDHRVLCRGANDDGRLGTGSAEPAVLDAWTELDIGEPVGSLALGSISGCALATSGAVYCWGSNVEGATGSGPPLAALPPSRVRLDAATALPSATAIRAGKGTACAITATGKLYCWGGIRTLFAPENETDPQRPRYAGAATLLDGYDVVDVGFDINGGCFLTRAGEVYCVGLRYFGLINDGLGGMFQPTPVRAQGLDAHLPIKQIAVGYGHVCVLGADGAVLCWAGSHKEEGGRSDPLASPDVPVVIQGLDDVAKIGSSDRSDFTCALRRAGDVLCWGQNIDAELGDAMRPASAVPFPVPELVGAVDLSVASDQVCALLAVGVPVCWGANAPPHREILSCP